MIDETAELFDEIYVSGGKRGMDIALRPGDLVAILVAVVAPDHRVTIAFSGRGGASGLRCGRRVSAQAGATQPSRARHPIGRAPYPWAST